MGEKLHSNSKGRFAPAMLAVAGLAFAMPAAVLAVGAPDTSSAAPGAIEYLPFTPAGADPQLARRVAEVIGEDALRFTPASKPRQSSERTVNFAVRVDDATARSISGGDLSGKVALATPEAISPIAGTRYNLGIARGFHIEAGIADEDRFVRFHADRVDGMEKDRRMGLRRAVVGTGQRREVPADAVAIEALPHGCAALARGDAEKKIRPVEPPQERSYAGKELLLDAALTTVKHENFPVTF